MIQHARREDPELSLRHLLCTLFGLSRSWYSARPRDCGTGGM